jgi:hypothetical protein
MNTRLRMTARFLELWDTMAVSPEECDAVLAAMLRHEFPNEPHSVHDAAISAAYRNIASRLRDQLTEILEREKAR